MGRVSTILRDVLNMTGDMVLVSPLVQPIALIDCRQLEGGPLGSQVFRMVPHKYQPIDLLRIPMSKLSHSTGLGRFRSSHTLSILASKLPMVKWALNAVTNDFATCRDVRTQMLKYRQENKLQIRKKKGQKVVYRTIGIGDISLATFLPSKHGKIFTQSSNVEY